MGGLSMHLIDLHCDTLSAILDKQQGLFRNTCHFDMERALAGGLKVQFMAIFVEPQAPTAALEKVCRRQYPADLLPGRCHCHTLCRILLI